MVLPSQNIPDDLSAQRYYELGLQYRLAGWVGLARKALSRVTELDKSGYLALKAEKVLRTQLPRLPVPERAEQRNIEAYNLMESDPKQAKFIFEELMQQFPDFEWPFSNLAWMKLREGDVSGARALAKYLLTLNPDHLRSVNLMVHVSLAEKNYDEALVFIDRGLDLYPHDDEFKQIKLAIKMEKQGLPPDVLPEGLGAEQYLDLAVEYQLVNRFENARQSANRALEIDSSGPVGVKAAKFLKAKLPKEKVPPEVEQRYLQAVELMRTDLQKAKVIFEQLVMDAPEFEWPFLMLSTLSLADGAARKAERLALRVVSHNPDMLEAKLLLVNLFIVQQKFKEALNFVEQTLTNLESSDDALALDLLRAQCQLQN